MIAGWNLVVLYPEYLLVRRAYHSDPALHERNKADVKQKKSLFTRMCGQMVMLCQGWGAYRRQTVAWAAFGLACLYVGPLPTTLQRVGSHASLESDTSPC